MSQDQCPNRRAFRLLDSSLDRLQEAAWFIRLMEENYHQSERFRWSLNSFLRALKEVIQVMTMEVQKNKPVSVWLKQEKIRIKNEPLVAFLFKQRDIVVHKEMLKPASKGAVGYTRGRGLKIGLGMPIDPMADSETAILRYIYHVAKTDFDFLGILYTEEDGSGEYTCVHREWRLQQFPQEEVTELAAEAWKLIANLTMATAAKLGAESVEPQFDLCKPNHVQFEIYSPQWVKEQLQRAKEHIAKQNA